jgi:hypothetical protein
LEVVDGDSSIRVNGSVQSKAEDIFYGLIRGFDLECSEERESFFESFLKPQVGDFLGGGVDLSVVISVKFMGENSLGVFDFGDIFSDTGSDESVLEPTVRSFDFAPGLRRKGVNDLDVAVLENLFPLRGRFVCEEVVFIPERVSSADETKDGVRIDVVGVRESITEDHGLESQDMGPAGLFFGQHGVEDESAIIIQGSDQIPFFVRGGGPEMVRGIVLDKFSGISG